MRLRVLLDARPTVTAFCHENPDGDTIGAAVAIALAGRAVGCEVEVVAEELPDAYRAIVADLPVRARPALSPGLAVVCDAATLDRIGSAAADCADWLSKAVVVALDHHVTNDRFGELNLVDPDAAASCEIVADLLPQLGIPLSPPMAMAVLTGIVRDSNGFSSASTRPGTLRAAADAMAAGADLESVYRSTLVAMPVPRTQLWGRLMARVRHDGDDPRIVYTVLTEEDLAATATVHHDAEGIVEFLQRGTGADVGILFRDGGGTTRVSVRTTGAADAARLLEPFGGGGHRQRSGCIVEGDTERVVGEVIAAARAALR